MWAKWSIKVAENNNQGNGDIKHKVSEHTDEDLPSTSKCGQCEYEMDLKAHMEPWARYGMNVKHAISHSKEK